MLRNGIEEGFLPFEALDPSEESPHIEPLEKGQEKRLRFRFVTLHVFELVEIPVK